MANIYDTPYFKDQNIGVRSLLTPQRVERGVNLLQNNQEIVNTLTGLPIGPASARAYLRNLSGSEEPITEDFFSSNQLAEIKNRTAKTMADFSMEDPNERSWNALNKVVPYDMSSLISAKGMFTNPKSDITGTLGTYTYKKNPDGTISAIDKHDFDSIEGGSSYLYGQAKEGVGVPEYRGTRGLPFLEPHEYPAEPGFFIQDDEMYGPANMYDTYPGGRFIPGEPAESVTKEEEIYQPQGEVLSEVIQAYKKGDITTSKLARIIGGMYGHAGTDLTPKDVFNQWNTTGKNLMREDWTQSGIPVNINMGRISHLDKLKANKNFARYIANTQTIPSKIRKQAAKHAGPVSTSPINVGNPFGYGRRKPDPPRGRDEPSRPSPSRPRDRGRSRSSGETGQISGGHHFNYGGIVSVL